jgi:hypothetical protein
MFLDAVNSLDVEFVMMSVGGLAGLYIADSLFDGTFWLAIGGLTGWVAAGTVLF